MYIKSLYCICKQSMDKLYFEFLYKNHACFPNIFYIKTFILKFNTIKIIRIKIKFRLIKQNQNFFLNFALFMVSYK